MATENLPDHVDLLQSQLERLLGGPVQPAPRGRDALVRALHAGGIAYGGHVCVTTTTGSACVSPCVRWALGRWRWGRRIEDSTRAVVVIHEWGLPHPELSAIARACTRHGWLLIEDCAHAFGTALWSGAVGRHGDYAIYSLPKFLSLGQGGLLRVPAREVSVTIPSAWSMALTRAVSGRREDGDRRRCVWRELSLAAASTGIVPLSALPEDAVPWMFPLRHRSIHHLAKQLVARGVAAEACVHVGATLIPCGGHSPSCEELCTLLHESCDASATLAPYRRMEQEGAWYSGR